MGTDSRKKQLSPKASILILFISSLFIVSAFFSCQANRPDDTVDTEKTSNVARKYAQYIDEKGISISTDKYNEIMKLIEETSVMTNLFFLDFPLVTLL